MIVQLQDDGVDTVIGFGATILMKAQKRYHISRKEALAIIWSLRHFHLYCSAKPFLWRTDHCALKFNFDALKTGVPVLRRYKLITDGYQFTTEWIQAPRASLTSCPESVSTDLEIISLDVTSLIPPPDDRDEGVALRYLLSIPDRYRVILLIRLPIEIRSNDMF